MNESIPELKRRIAELERVHRRTGVARPSRGLLAGLAAFVVAFAAAGYASFGNTDGWLDGLAPGGTAATEAGHETAQFEVMAERLAARLRDQPADAEGWAMLARTYLVLQRFEAAVPAFRRAAEVAPVDASLYADWADALAMVNGGRLEGEPQRLVEQALKLDPNHVKALSLAGTVAFRAGRHAEALRYWERALLAVEPGSDAERRIAAAADDARSRLGTGAAAPVLTPDAPTQPAVTSAAPPRGPAAKGTVSGVVRLADTLRSQASPDDTVFVFARPADGSRAPVAIVRTKVGELPYRFTLDDSTAMNAQRRLSGESSVIVGARVSKTGDAMRRPGDLEGYSARVAVGAAGVQLEIGEVVP